MVTVGGAATDTVRGRVPIRGAALSCRATSSSAGLRLMVTRVMRRHIISTICHSVVSLAGVLGTFEGIEIAVDDEPSRGMGTLMATERYGLEPRACADERLLLCAGLSGGVHTLAPRGSSQALSNSTTMHSPCIPSAEAATRDPPLRAEATHLSSGTADLSSFPKPCVYCQVDVERIAPVRALEYVTAPIRCALNLLAEQHTAIAGPTVVSARRRFPRRFASSPLEKGNVSELLA